MLGQPELVADLIPRSHLSRRADTAASHYHAVEKVILAMRKSLDEHFSLEDMADVAIMSRFHFNRTFHELVGIPPCQFLSAVRLEAAKRLLLTTEMSVTDVCFEVGYNSLGTFIRRFTELVGMSPRRLRSMAVATPSGVFGPLQARSSEARQTFSGLLGRVLAPSEFRGPIFVGLFSTPIPQGQPVGCTVTRGPGFYHLRQVPNGRFFLFAAGLPQPQDPCDLYLYESALRAGGQEICASNGLIHGSTDLALRPACTLDPPILMALPVMVRPGLNRTDELAVAG